MSVLNRIFLSTRGNLIVTPCSGVCMQVFIRHVDTNIKIIIMNKKKRPIQKVWKGATFLLMLLSLIVPRATTTQGIPLVVDITATNDLQVVVDIANSVLQVTCDDLTSGEIALDITGGLPPFDFSFTIDGNLDILTGTGTVISGLAAGTYDISVVDGNGCEVTGINVEIMPPDDCEVQINNDFAEVTTNVMAEIDILANDDIPDGVASVNIVQNPSFGSATVVANPLALGEFYVEYMPDVDYQGMDNFTYEVCDTDGDCAQGVVSLSILELSEQCNLPIVGKYTVVDQVSAGLAGLLLGGTEFENVIDGDLTNFTEIDLTAAVLGASLVSVKNIQQTYNGGQRVGFVIQSSATLLSADVLGGLQINTYLDNTLQESATIAGNLIDVSIFGGTGSKRRIEFTTTLDFDEVELVYNSAVAALSSIRIYHAYQENPSCDPDCVTTLTTDNYAGATASTGCVGLFCTSFNNPDNVVDPNLGLFASKGYLLGGNAWVQVDAGVDIPGGYEVGFVTEQVGLLGLLSTDVLSNITITTYDASDNVVETYTASNNLANVGLLDNGLVSISFKSTAAFRKARIQIVSVLDLLTTYRVYYGFVRPDSDNDGVVDCIDKCPDGDDNIVNNLGLPLACNPECMVEAGPDISACPDTDSGMAQLPAAGPGQTWSADPSNPAPATVDNAGVVTGMTVEGIYQFILSDGMCMDTVAISFIESNLDSDCNDPIAATDVIIDDIGQFNGTCLLCSEAGAENVIDGDLSNYLEYSSLLSLVTSTSLISVKDTANTYASGMNTRVGFAVGFPDGLLSAQLLGAIQLRTYLDNNLVEIADIGNTGTLEAGALGNGDGLQRLSFIATQEFDEIELIIGDVLGLLTTIRVYYAFEEPESCPNGLQPGDDPSVVCIEPLTAASQYCASINYDRTGFLGLACALCETDQLSHLVDDDIENFATLNLTVGALAQGAIAVQTSDTFPAGYQAGYVISADASLLTTDVLTNISVITYLGGIEQESLEGTSSLLDISAIGDSVNLGFIGFRTSLPFNEIQLVVDAPVSANLLNDLSIYYAYVRRDTDGDGTPDCLDKCCSGDDTQDSDGDGTPDACDDAESCLTLDVKCFLEGALIDPSGSQTYGSQMRTTLNDARILPGQTYEDFFFGIIYSPPGQPFSGPPWNYDGTEGMDFDSDGDPAMGDAGYPANVVDWVLVSLRTDSAVTGGPICMAAATLLSDGTVQLVEPLDCCGAIDTDQDYYLVIEARNHLIVMSDVAIPIVDDTLSYDFTIKDSYIDDPFEFGIFVGQKQVAPGVYALFAGNGNQTESATSDTDLNFGDRSFWEDQNGEFGEYSPADYNLNGDINLNDRVLWELNNGKFTSVPRN